MQTRGWALGMVLLGGWASACASDGGDVERAARIYATIAGSHEVAVIDDDTHEVLRTIPVGQGPAILLSTPDHGQLYSANWADDTISAIDVATDEVTSIAVGSRPYVIAMSPDGARLYAGLQANAIAVIDTETNAVVQMFGTPQLPASLIVSPDGATLYVATLLPSTLRAISATTGEVIHPAITVGSMPAWITISHDGTQVFTLNFLSDDVTVVDTESWTITETVETGAGTQGIIGNVTPDDTHLYVTNHGTSDMIAIDTSSYAITQTIELTGRPVGVNFNDDGSRVYVTDFGPASLSVPADVTYLTTGNFTGSGNGQVSVFDVTSGERIGNVIDVGPGATSVVVIP